MSKKQSWMITHEYDTDGGFGDAITVRDVVAIVEATEEEIDAFLKEWNKPRIYDRPYANLYEHYVTADPVEVQDLSKVVPYDPVTKDWPDIPRQLPTHNCHYNEETDEWEYTVLDYSTGTVITKTIKNTEDN